jgi:hypothetical protein
MTTFLRRLSPLIAIACTSCSGERTVYPVSGRVTVDGSPASGALVHFHRPGSDSMNDPMIMAVVQDDGSFDLVTGSLGPGAPPGSYDVLIVWTSPAPHSNGRPQHSPDKLKGKYADRAHPLLHALIKPESNHLAPFDLTSQ